LRRTRHLLERKGYGKFRQARRRRATADVGGIEVDLVTGEIIDGNSESSFGM
jgi:hypothetical protein